MNKSWKLQVIENFAKAAPDYEQAANWQQKTNQHFIEFIKKHSLKNPEKILEIGCGTGFLSRKLSETFPQTNLTLTDITPEMLEQTQKNLPPNPACILRQMDGEQTIDGQYDMIISSLTDQWYEERIKAIQNHKSALRQGGRIFMASLTKKSMKPWEEAATQAGIKTNHNKFLTESEAEEICKQFKKAEREYIEIKEQYDSGEQFLKSMKKIGAHTAIENPSSLSALRQAIKSLNQQSPLRITYEIAFLSLEI